MIKQLFLLDYEKEFDFITQDSIIVKQQLDKCLEKYEYEIICANTFYATDTQQLLSEEAFPESYKNAIPIGSIQFVSAFLKIFHNIEAEAPLEIPLVWRNSKYLKRDYRIVSYEDLPKEGEYFIKDVTDQRTLATVGEIKKIIKGCTSLSNTHFYQVSEIVDIIAEYRIYVINGKIKNICFYKGDPIVLPDLDLIKCAIKEYNDSEDPLASYSFDVMVTTRGTAIIEMHTFLSLGLFSTVWDRSLLKAYSDCFHYVLKHNNKLTQ